MSDLGNEPHIIITLTDIYREVVEVKAAVSQLPLQVQDHETRLRALERRVWGWTAASGGGGGILGALITWLLSNAQT